MQIKQVFLVSKKSHLEFALPEFRKHSVFKDVQPLESPEVYAQSIQEMVDYLKAYDDHEVRTRLEALRRNGCEVDNVWLCFEYVLCLRQRKRQTSPASILSRARNF